MVNLQGLYAKYEDTQQKRNWKNYALWTLPYVFPDVVQSSNTEGNQDVQHDYQSTGARLVNHLAAKLVRILFPVNYSFFRIEVSPELKEALANTVDSDGKKSVNSFLAELETGASSRLFRNASYAQLVMLLRYLIITGNALLYRDTKDSKLVVYNPSCYTCLRNRKGELLDLVLRETVTWGSLPADVRKGLTKNLNREESAKLDVYTRVKADRSGIATRWIVTQEIEGQQVGTPSEFTDKENPYVVVTWNLTAGDSYGRGHVEDHAGDFAKLSDLSRALTLYELNSCKIVNLVKPGSTADVDELNDAQCGEFVQGNPDAIQALESGDGAKIQQLSNNVQMIEQRLSVAFMYAANQRDAERVTAEEIKLNAEEAEQTLGGVYSQLSQALHLPLAYLLLAEQDPEFMVQVLIGNYEPSILTGIPALGRNAKTQAILAVTQELAAIIPALKQISPRFDVERIIDDFITSRGLKLEDVMLSEEDLAAAEEAARNAVPELDPLATTEAIQQLG